MAERRIPSSRPATQPVSLKARHCRIALAVATCFTAGVLTAHAAGGNLPTGASYDPSKVASITTSGNVMTIKTLANRTVFGWDNHDIGAGYGVNYIQPTASSWVLSKVNSPDPTTIYGSLTSNGGVWLINKSGILVGNGARIDVAGFIGSTLNVTDANFLAGKLKFDATLGAGGVTIEQGAKITTPSGGSVYLVAPNVSNAGIITTSKGETILAAGETVELIDTGTPGVKVEITGAVGNATNLGEIYAEAGRIGIAGVLVKNSGTLNASSVVNEGGRVFLKASQDAYVDGNGRIVTTGTKGGSVQVLGNRVAVAGSASIDASGDFGGGEVLVGGDYQGKNSAIQNAKATYFGSNASIKADARVKGNGGKVIVWADDTTRAYGAISARGGAQGGNGGFIETSGGWLDTVGIRVSAAAPHGKSGTWLLDPYNLEVVSGTDAHGTDASTPGEVTYFGYADGASVIDHSTIEGQLNTGTNVILDTHLPNSSAVVGTDVGDITVNAAINKTAGGDATLWLKADRSIIINEAITSTSGALGVTLQAHANDTNPGAAGNVQIYANITTNGGNVLIGGGDLSSTLSGYANGYDYTSYTTRYGVLVESTIDAGGGNITIRGAGINNPIAGDTDGVEINNGSLITSGSGAIKLYGQAGSGATSATSGVYVWGSIHTEAGDIVIEGHGGAGSSSANRGVKLDGASIYSDSGNITLSGFGGNNDYGSGNIGILFNGSGNSVTSNSGNIKLEGYGGGGFGYNSAGVWMDSGSTISTSGTGYIDIYGVGAYASNSSDGVHIEGSQIYTNGTGYVRITGYSSFADGTGSGYGGTGVYLANTQISSGDGNIEITGYSGGDSTTWYNDGVKFTDYTSVMAYGSGNVNVAGYGGSGNYSNGVSIVDGASVNSYNGNVAILGFASGSGTISNLGVYIGGYGGVAVGTYGVGSLLVSGQTTSDDVGLSIGSGRAIYASAGDITLEAGSAGADSISLVGASIDGYGTLYLRPVLGSTSIGIGNGAVGAFNIDDADHAAVSASNNFTQLVIGRSGGSHAIEINRDVDPTNVVFNASSVTLTSGHTMTFSYGGSVAVYGGYFNNDGTVDLNHGTFYTDNGFSNNGGALLKGPGTIGGNLDNYGTVWVNGGGSGTLSITGNFTQYGGGTLKVDVAGNGQSDLLQVGGTANLDGTLYLNAGYGGYLTSAPPGDSFTVLSAGTVIGDFYGGIVNQGVFTTPNITGTTYALSVSGGGGCGDGFEACWIGGNGLWSDAGNWLNGYIPVNSTDDVRLDGTGYTITYDGPSLGIGKFYSAHDHFVFNGYGGNSFTTNGTVNFGSGTSFTVNDGTVNFNGQTTLYQFALNGGTANFNYNSADNVIARLSLNSGAYGGGTLGGSGFVRVTESFSQQAYGGYINRTGGLDITQAYGDLAYYGGNTGSLGLHATDGNIFMGLSDANVSGSFQATASGNLEINSVRVYAYEANVNVGGTFSILGTYGNAGLDVDGPVTVTAGNVELVASAYGGNAYIYSSYGGINIHTGNLLLQSGNGYGGSAYIQGNYGNIDITATGAVTLDASMGGTANMWSYGGNVLISAQSVSLISGYGNAYIEAAKDPFSLQGGNVVIATSGDVTLNSMYGGSVDIGAYGGGAVTIGAGGTVRVDGGEGSISAWNGDVNISAGNVLLTGNGSSIYTQGGDIHIHTTGDVSLTGYGSNISAQYGLVDIVTGGSVSLDNGSYIYTYGSWYGSNAINILAGRDVSLNHGSSIWAENDSAPPDVTIGARGNISLDNGSYIHAGNDVNLVLMGANSELRLNSSEGYYYSYIVSDYQMEELATTKITFLSRTSGGIVIDGTPTTLASQGSASYYGGSGIFAGTGYVPVWDKNGVELLYLGNNEAAKTVNNVLNDFFDKLANATDIEGDAAAKKKKLESEQQGSDQNGQENKSANHCS